MICVQVTMCARRAIDEEVSAAEGQELLLDAIRSVEQRGAGSLVQKQIDRNLQLLNSLLSVLLAKSRSRCSRQPVLLRCFEKPVARCYC